MNDLISLREARDRHVVFVVTNTDRLKEAARILGVDTKTLRRWRARLNLPKRKCAVTQS